MTDHWSRLPAVTGTGFQAATFAELFCERDQHITPHAAGKILSLTGGMVEMAVRCRRCGLQAVHAMDQLPAGYQVYHVRVTGEDGPHLPAELRPVPYVEEEFDVVGASPQDAYERAEFAHSLRLTGQLTRFYLNGEVHLDERF